jgi:hypothetical protein
MAEEREPAILSRMAPYWQLPHDPLILDLNGLIKIPGDALSATFAKLRVLCG